MTDGVYAIRTEEECERLDAQALLAGVSDHVRHVPAHPGMRILDAGCGSGSMAREIAKVAPRSVVVGIDTETTGMYRVSPTKGRELGHSLVTDRTDPIGVY